MLTHVEANAVAVLASPSASPLVSGVAMAAADQGQDLDALIVRKEAKATAPERGWKDRCSPGALITVLEDVVTTGAPRSRRSAAADAGYTVHRVVTIVDREEGVRPPWRLTISN